MVRVESGVQLECHNLSNQVMHLHVVQSPDPVLFICCCQVNIIPVIAKADTFTSEECAKFKALVSCARWTLVCAFDEGACVR